MIPAFIYDEALRAAFAPIAAHLDDESVTEIMINGPHEIFIERSGRLTRTESRF